MESLKKTGESKELGKDHMESFCEAFNLVEKCSGDSPWNEEVSIKSKHLATLMNAIVSLDEKLQKEKLWAEEGWEERNRHESWNYGYKVGEQKLMKECDKAFKEHPEVLKKLKKLFKKNLVMGS